MAWGRTAFGRGAWAGGEIPSAALPGWQDVPPPGAGASTSFGYLVANGVSPWAFRSWGGATAVPTYPGGGVSVAADPARGVMRVWAWWPDTPTLQLIRITPDGVRTPVRGGYPLRITQPTRRNLCSNPSVEASTAGYLGINAQTTLARITKPADRRNLCPNPSAEVDTTGWSARTPTNPAITAVTQGNTGWSGSKAVTATAASSGTGGVVLPIGQIVESTQYTISLYAFGPATSRTFSPFVDWLDMNGAYLSTSTGTPVATGAAWARLSTTATAPAGAKFARPYVTVAGLVAGEIVSFDAALYEAGTLQTYFDGDTAGARWDGTDDVSTSTLPNTTYVPAGTYALRMTTSNTVTGAILPGSLPGTGDFTFSFGLALSTAPSSVVITVDWINAAGAGAGTTTINLTSDQITASLGRGARQVARFSAPASAVSGTVKLTVNGVVAGTTTVDVDAVVIEPGTTDGSFFDGTTFGGNWTGTAHLSTSLLAPVQVIDDGECPLDVPVIYEAYNAALIGGRMQAAPVTLASQGRTWLTHPLSASAPMVVDLRTVPTLTHEADQGVFYALGSPYATVVSGLRRRAPVGTALINAISAAEHTALLAAFGDMSPVLVRSPADFYYADGYQWIVLGTLSDDREGRKAFHDAWLLSAPFYEVVAPDPALAA